MGDSHYPSRRFGNVWWGPAAWASYSRAEAEAIAGAPDDPHRPTVLELVPAADMDALRDLARAVQNDEQIQEGQCSRDLIRAIAALSPAFLETLEKP